MFVLLLTVLGLQRIFELQISTSNCVHLKRRGGYEVGSGHYPLMVFLHAAWFASMIWEYLCCSSTLPWWTVLLGWSLLLAGQSLRWLAIVELRRRWTTRIVVVPGLEPVQTGLFRWLRHPNYLGVCLEILGVPLVGGCWRTALAFSLANLMLLRYRIAVEERALSEAGDRET